MTLIAFLPRKAEQSLRRFVSRERLMLAKSWREVESLLHASVASAMILDPGADGTINVQAVVDLMKKFPATPAVAYVSLSGHNLRAVFELSQHGLSEVVLHSPDGDPHRLAVVLDKTSAGSSVKHLVSRIERSLTGLRPSAIDAVFDLFHRPHRYGTAADIALQGKMSPKSLYRSFGAAGLGTPKRFLTAAKLLRGYCYLRDSKVSVTSAATSVGYSRSANFTRDCIKVFGCPPTALRKEDREIVVSVLVQWLHPTNSLSIQMS